MAGDARILIGIDHLAMLAHGELLVELVAAPERVAHERRPLRVFEPHPAEAFGGPEQHVLERSGLRLQIPVLHDGRSAAFDAGAQGYLGLAHGCSPTG